MALKYLDELKDCCRALAEAGHDDWRECGFCGASVKFFDDGRAEPYVGIHEPPPAVVAVVVVNRAGDTLHDGWSVLWRGLTLEQGRGVCGDERAVGANYFLAWTDDAKLADKPGREQEGRSKWRWARDDGRHDGLLAEHGLRAIDLRGAA
jgi:hypothetical protein